MILNKIASCASILLLTYGSMAFAKDSITANYHGYVSIADQASKDEATFAIFRTYPQYRTALEIDNGEPYADYISYRASVLGKHMQEFRKLDDIGAPPVQEYRNLGSFSATTLRYIFHADQILKYFSLPQNPIVAEIGAGFGGQSHILQVMHPCQCYYIYDLPQVEALINRVMLSLDRKNVYCLPIDEELPEEEIDLFISNYAYSECDREMQLSYFDRVIKKSKRGYMIYNQIAITDYGMDSISISEFLSLLKKQGIKPRVYKEFFAGAGNSLIIWDKTK